ncbi:Reticulon-like protein B21 [Bienertia sinuspersici]
MERGKKKTTTRRTRNVATMADSVHDTRMKMGRIKPVRPTAIATNNVINDQLRKRKTENSNLNAENTTTLLTQGCNSDSAESSCSSDQKSLHEISGGSKVKLSSEHAKVLKKTRSEPIEGSSSSESELRKVKSDNWNHGNKNDEVAESCDMEVNLNDCDLNHDEQIEDQQNDSTGNADIKIDAYEEDEDEEELDDQIEQKTEQEVKSAVEKSCEEEKKGVSPKDKMVIDVSSDRVDCSKEVEGEDEGKQRKNVDNDDSKEVAQKCGGDGDEVVQHTTSKKELSDPANSNLRKARIDDEGEGEPNKIADQRHNNNSGVGDGLILLKKIKSKRVTSPTTAESNLGIPKSTSTSSSTATTPVSRERPSSRSIHKPTLKPQTPAREVSKQYHDVSATPETQSKLQSLVDLVLWRDVSKTAFIFGFGTFIIISSSYAKDFNFSFISCTSYISLVYLAVVFFYKSFMNREVMDREEWPEKYVWGEEEAVWFVKLILPYMNEFVLKLRGIFSGDPAMTMKLAVVLFVLARCGSSITLWKTIKLGFFGVFLLPKLCSSYSPHITAYGNFWIGRFRDAWESCSHKKAAAFAIFTLVWNFSSVVARAWAAFMLFVAFRYYQQSLMTHDDFIDEEKTESESHNNIHIRHLTRNRCRVAASSDQRKQKKSF